MRNRAMCLKNVPGGSARVGSAVLVYISGEEVQNAHVSPCVLRVFDFTD